MGWMTIDHIPCFDPVLTVAHMMVMKNGCKCWLSTLIVNDGYIV